LHDLYVNIHLVRGGSGCERDRWVELPLLDLTVFPITNHFFGEAITVSGLLTGSDILIQMKPLLEKNPCDLLLLPENALRSGTDTLLDDWTLETLGEALNVIIQGVPVQGEDLLQILLED